MDHLHVLCLDTASPTTSVALAHHEEETKIIAQWASDGHHSSRRLLKIIDELLAQADWRPSDLDALMGLAGPGSFTGARVGLATLYGLHQSLGIPALAVPTTRVLAHQATTDALRILAVVDALRDEWYVEEFAADDLMHPRSSPTLVPSQELVREEEAVVVGFGVERLAALGTAPSCQLQPALALAATAFTLLAEPGLGPPQAWDPATLLAPIYARPPAMVERRVAKR